MKNTLLLLLIFLSFQSNIFASDSLTISDFSNTMGLTQSPLVTPHKKLFIQTSLEGVFNVWDDLLYYSPDYFFRNKNHKYSLPELRVSYGISKRFEIHGGATLIHRYNNLYNRVSKDAYIHWPEGPVTYTSTNLNLFRLGVKYQILSQNKWKPNLSVQSTAVLYDEELHIPTSVLWGYNLGKRWNLRGDFTYNFFGYGRDLEHVELSEFSASISANCEIIKKLGLTAGLATTSINLNLATNKPLSGWYPVSAGMYYRINDKMLADAKWTGIMYNHVPGSRWKMNAVAVSFNWMLF